LSDQLTDAHYDWTTKFTGKDPRQADAAPAAASGGAPATKKFSIGVPGLPKLRGKACGGRIDIEVVPVIRISGTAALDAADATNIDVKGFAAAAMKVAFNWQASAVQPAVSGGSLFGNLKVERKGASIGASSSTNTQLGKFSLAVTFVGVGGTVQKDAGGKFTLKVLEAKAELIGHQVKLPDTEIDGVKLTDLQIETGASVTMGPNWAGIIADWAIETAGKEIAVNAGEGLGEAAVAVVSLEGALIVGGAAAVGVSIYSLVCAWGIGDLAQSYKPSIDSARAGFKAGMSGGSAPSDQYGKVGYAAGSSNYQALFERTRKANPEASDDAIKAAIAAKADEALNQVAAAIDHNVRVGLWDGYLAQHTTILISSDAKWAFVACFGELPKDSHPEWKKYLAQHPTGSKF
jgi:hypothetical protein